VKGYVDIHLYLQQDSLKKFVSMTTSIYFIHYIHVEKLVTRGRSLSRLMWFFFWRIDVSQRYSPVTLNLRYSFDFNENK